MADPETNPGTPSLSTNKKKKKKRGGNLNTKKTFKQIRSRTFIAVILIASLFIYFYTYTEDQKEYQARFREELLKEIDSTNQKSEERMQRMVDMIDSMFTSGNKAVLQRQQETTSRIQQSIRTLQENQKKNDRNE